jgi:hypothetical protein
MLMQEIILITLINYKETMKLYGEINGARFDILTNLIKLNSGESKELLLE